MSILFYNADDYADTSGTPPVIGYPCTIVAWAKPAALGSQDRILHLGRNDSTNVDSFVLRKTSGDLLQATVVAATEPEASNATTVNGMTADTWHHCAGIFASSTSRTVYLDGDAANKGTNTGSRTPTANFTKYRVGLSMESGDDWNGRIAHVAVWDIALSEANIQALAAGANPLTIENANLVWYCPTLVDESPMQDRIASLDLTLGNNAVYSSDNPTVDAEITLQAFQYQSRLNPLLRM